MTLPDPDRPCGLSDHSKKKDNSSTVSCRVFLVNRLHNIPGYYNSPGKNDLHETEEKHECLKMHERPGKPGYLNADRNQEILQRLFTDPSSAQAAEAWMRLASSSDRRAVEDMIQTAVCAPKTRSKGPAENRTYVAEGVAQCVKTDYVAGVTDWINKATKEETVAVEKLFRTLSTNPNKPLHSSVTGSSAQQRGLKYCAMDFQIHPEWISKPWHIHYRRSHT
ncbi:uncharacterized protein LOC122794087 isoform X2 [Protopterus annectens]|uniref:uncharacterized protein LOC122794087 isoform X2 n=1 Tax=Protopterus annectens TaxID=7888 RepID=UPI001CF94386|nr:uncharacterized protein LOC122794087 isoform X2 [Protopterus annectens]